MLLTWRQCRTQTVGPPAQEIGNCQQDKHNNRGSKRRGMNRHATLQPQEAKEHNARCIQGIITGSLCYVGTQALPSTKKELGGSFWNIKSFGRANSQPQSTMKFQGSAAGRCWWQIAGDRTFMMEEVLTGEWLVSRPEKGPGGRSSRPARAQQAKASRAGGDWITVQGKDETWRQGEWDTVEGLTAREGPLRTGRNVSCSETRERRQKIGFLRTWNCMADEAEPGCSLECA